jgi:RNA polymerase subunit RPABC4/transcription elongation factor Spt4
MVVWAYRDMRERTHDGWSHAVAVVLVGIFSIAGLFLYLLLRPHETLAEAYERRLEAEMLAREVPQRPRACPRCERPTNEDFMLCPYCRTTLREPCTGCERALELDWIACPYCGAQGPRTPGTIPASISAGPPAAPAPAKAPPTPSATARRPAGSAATRTRRPPASGSSSS